MIYLILVYVVGNESKWNLESDSMVNSGTVCSPRHIVGADPGFLSTCSCSHQHGTELQRSGISSRLSTDRSADSIVVSSLSSTDSSAKGPSYQGMDSMLVNSMHASGSCSGQLPVMNGQPYGR